MNPTEVASANSACWKTSGSPSQDGCRYKAWGSLPRGEILSVQHGIREGTLDLENARVLVLRLCELRWHTLSEQPLGGTASIS